MARFKIDEAVDSNKMRSYESPDIPNEGRYVLLIKQADSMTLFPLTQKLIFTQCFNSKIDNEDAIKNTLLLMRNRKVKNAKIEKVEVQDNKEKEGSEGRQ